MYRRSGSLSLEVWGLWDSLISDPHDGTKSHSSWTICRCLGLVVSSEITLSESPWLGKLQKGSLSLLKGEYGTHSSHILYLYEILTRITLLELYVLGTSKRITLALGGWTWDSLITCSNESKVTPLDPQLGVVERDSLVSSWLMTDTKVTPLMPGEQLEDQQLLLSAWWFLNDNMMGQTGVWAASKDKHNFPGLASGHSPTCRLLGQRSICGNVFIVPSLRDFSHGKQVWVLIN